MMSADELLESLCENVPNREYDHDLHRALARAEGHGPVTWADGKWRVGGFVTYFQQQWDILRAVDPSLPVGLPTQCLDPKHLGNFFGIPLEDFDWRGGSLAQIESKLDTLLEIGRGSSRPPTASGSLAEPPVIEMRRRGTDWHLRFQKGDIREEDSFPNLLGFHCWEVLLDNPRRRFDPEDLERTARLPPPRQARRMLLATGGRMDADADTREAVPVMDDGVDGVGFAVAEAETVTDHRTIKDLDREVAGLEAELASTVNPERRQELQEQIFNNKAWRGRLVNRNGQPRPLNLPANELARKRVRNLLDRAKAEIGKKMPRLAHFLAITEQALEYDPSRAI